MPMTLKDYERVKIAGILTVASPLCIGSGTAGAIESDAGQSEYLEICTGHGGNPYIPASSLRGLLADLGRTWLEEAEHIDLFGTARSDTGKTGALRVYDAPLDEPAQDEVQDLEQPERLAGKAHQALRTRIALDPVTGTAQDQHLFNFASVPQGKRFCCTLELDRVNAADVKNLLGLLGLLDGAGRKSRLGKGANRLEGRVRWEGAIATGLTPKGLADWLCRDQADAPLNYATLALEGNRFASNEAGVLHIPFLLRPQGPLLVDPLRFPPNQDEDGKAKEPGMRFRRTAGGRLLLPAASLRGLLRGHCRKILMTLLVDKIADIQPPYDEAQRIADELLGDLFGHTGKRGAVAISDAVDPAEASAAHLQTFNAIDRFTGGVAKGALYTVEAAGAECLEGEMYIDTRRLREPQSRWWQGLLLLALRDGMEGDFAVGWGKAKGYGVVTVGVRAQGTDWNDWPSLMQAHGGPVREAVQALQDALAARIDQLRPEEVLP